MCNVHVMAMRWMRTIHVMARKRKQADGLSTYVRKACQNFWCSGTPNTLLQPIMRPKSSPARVFLAGASTGLSASQFQHGAKMRSQFQHGPSAFLGPNIYIMCFWSLDYFIYINTPYTSTLGSWGEIMRFDSWHIWHAAMYMTYHLLLWWCTCHFRGAVREIYTVHMYIIWSCI